MKIIKYRGQEIEVYRATFSGFDVACQMGKTNLPLVWALDHERAVELMKKEIDRCLENIKTAV